MRLFCFPYAGGSAAVFREFARGLPDGLEVWAANLPGHGSRLGETPLQDMRQLADGVAQEVALLNELPFAFFGHSLGARLAFEAARALRRRGQDLPEHLFAAACAAPQLPASDRAWHTLADADLVRELSSHNGLPEALLAEPQVLALFLPALRADLALFETAVYEQERPFDFPITALGGNRDTLVSVKELEAWQEQSTRVLRLALFEGDHFFLRAAQTAVLDGVAKALPSVGT